jgi:coenzyme PQQ biosynthesis probable peptidase PqqF
MSKPDTALAQPQHIRGADGARLCLLSQAGTRAAACVRIAAGSHDEPRAYPGLAHFLEHLLFLGGQHFTGEQRLMPFVQGCGGQLNASTHARFTDFFFEVPSEHFVAALERLADMLATPLLDIDAQRREREVLHAEFIARSQDVDTLIDTALGQLLPAEHPTAAFLAGNHDTLPVEQVRFQRALRGFHRRHYQRGQVLLTLLGPQPLSQLRELGERFVSALPVGLTAPRVPARGAALLPLRARYLRMTTPDNAPRQLFAWALTWPVSLPPAACEQAVAALRLALMDPSADGLLAYVQQAGLVRGMRLQLAYNHHPQALLRLVVDLAQDTPHCRAHVRAALASWLGFVAATEHASVWVRVLRHQQHAAQRGTILEQAQRWQNWHAWHLNPAALDPQAGEALQRLLAHLSDERCRLEGEAAAALQPVWHTGGFAVRMAVCPVPAPQAFERAWRLADHNPLIKPPTSAPLARSACWRWQAAASAEGRAVLYGRRQDLDAHGRAAARDVLYSLENACSEYGVELRVSDEAGAQTLCLRGPAEPLGLLAAQIWTRWLQPDPPSAGFAAPAAGAGLPIRQVLAQLDELIQPAPLHTLGIEGFGIGVLPQDQARLQALFSQQGEWCDAPVCGPCQSHWRALALPPGEHVLVLFCPQSDVSAECEAAWRLLAQRLQPAYYQRLRSELQLGYAVFSGYRQVAGVRGVLFAVQSPQVPPAALIEHIAVFLRECPAADLDAATLEARAFALQAQRCDDALSLDGAAEQAWLDLLAGLAPNHAAAVNQALLALTPDALHRAYQQLCEGPWRVLANAAPPDHWRLPS